MPMILVSVAVISVFWRSVYTDCPQIMIIGLSASITFEIVNWSEYALE